MWCPRFHWVLFAILHCRLDEAINCVWIVHLPRVSLIIDSQQTCMYLTAFTLMHFGIHFGIWQCLTPYDRVVSSYFRDSLTVGSERVTRLHHSSWSLVLLVDSLPNSACTLYQRNWGVISGYFNSIYVLENAVELYFKAFMLWRLWGQTTSKKLVSNVVSIHHARSITLIN